MTRPPIKFGLLNNAFALNIILVGLAVINLIWSTFINIGLCLTPQLVYAAKNRSKASFLIIFSGIYVSSKYKNKIY